MLSQPVPLNTGQNKNIFVWFWSYGCVTSNQPDHIVRNIIKKAQIVCTRHFRQTGKVKTKISSRKPVSKIQSRRIQTSSFQM